MVIIHFFAPNDSVPPPAFASFLAFSAARFSSLACPPFGLFFSDLEFGFGLKASFGGMLLIFNENYSSKFVV
jgi:hypothetical protein